MFTADFWGRVANNASKGTTTGSVWSQMQGTLMTLIWVFIGVEGASVMAHRAKSRSAAQQASIIAFVTLVVIYVLISILPYGALTRAQLASMGQPAIGHVLQATVGTWGSILINVGLIISTIVSWLSWTMLPAETTMLVAEDKAMPKVWGKVNSKNAPTASLMITAVLQTIFLFSLLFTDKANFLLKIARFFKKYLCFFCKLRYNQYLCLFFTYFFEKGKSILWNIVGCLSILPNFSVR